MRIVWVKPCFDEVLATPTWTGGVFDRDSLCFSLAVAVRGGGDTVKTVAVLFFKEVGGGEPERETVRVVRCCSNTSSSSSSSKPLKSGSVQREKYMCTTDLGQCTNVSHVTLCIT